MTKQANKMTKQAKKKHAVASAPSFYGQYDQSNEPQYTTELSSPSTKDTYACPPCRKRSLTCDSDINQPCTKCIKNNTPHACTSLPRNSIEVFLPNDSRVAEQPSIPFYQYGAEQGWNLGQQRKRAPWETQAQLAPWGSEVLNGRAAGTAEEPMSVTSNMP